LGGKALARKLLIRLLVVMDYRLLPHGRLDRRRDRPAAAVGLPARIPAGSNANATKCSLAD